MEKLLPGIDLSFIEERLPTVEEIRSVDKRSTCDCPMPFVHRKWHRALGTFAELRLCCMARKIEEVLGIPQGTFYKAIDFEPTRVWDEGQMVDDTQGGMKPLGEPPKWLKMRMENKGIKTRKSITGGL